MHGRLSRVDTDPPVGRWGSAQTDIDPRTLDFARKHLGAPVATAPVSEWTVQPSGLDEARCAVLFPGIEASVADQVRARFARGMSYPDLLGWRSGESLDAPDAVLLPRDHAQTLDAIAVCSDNNIAVVPVGGATSVTGAINLGHPDRIAVAISTQLLNGVLELDEESGIVHVGSGMSGPELEDYLRPHGWTLGHYPQSFERASIGGYLAARSSGQASSGYGRIEDMVIGATLATPIGTWRVGGFPASSSGPDMRHLVLGSEGIFGVITSTHLRVRRLPRAVEYTAAIIPGDFDTAAAVVRSLARSPLRPTVVRASDPAETQALVTMSLPRGFLGSMTGRYLNARRALPGSLLILGFEFPDAATLRASRAVTNDVLSASGAVRLGSGPGKSWKRGRFHGPYLRDQLMDAGYLVETFETVARWSDLSALHQRLSDRAKELLGVHSYVMCHISHSYDTGASLYFTVLAGGWGDPREATSRWRSVKTALMEEISQAGAAVSHHHGVGRDHREWLPEQIGHVGVEVLQALRKRLDPHGVMNPGAVIDRSDGGMP